MKKITLAQAIELQKKANTPELLAELLKALLSTIEFYESAPDQSGLIKDLQKKLDTAIQEKESAEEVANAALETANELLATVPQEIYATVEKKKYKVLFGVDGLTKEELVKDQVKLQRLIEIGSGALELQEGK
ncbi:hypothetical protein [Pedobacter antarcticus]|uniref:hypothetical protein n=1 Tax=Pedobacter antarcticus TaxID=34086 RepID=UPI00292E778C|nr:hypothetical protein [Pedobacter antarcticus]